MTRREMDNMVGRLQALWNQLTKDPKQCLEFILNFHNTMPHIVVALNGLKDAATALGWADAVEPLERDVNDFIAKYNREKAENAERKRKFISAIVSPDQVMLDGLRMKRVFIDRIINPPEFSGNARIRAGVINFQDLHAKAEADAKLRDDLQRAKDCCQSCAELGKACPEHQRPVTSREYVKPITIPMSEFEPYCTLCTADLKCPQHRDPPLSRADIFKSGFEALIVRVEQLKGDLSLLGMDNQLLRNQRDHYESEAKRLQTALEYANERIKKLESDR